MSSITDILVGFAKEKNLLDWVSFGLSCAALIEWFVFSCINLRTFANVLANPDPTTSIPRAAFMMIMYFVLRLIFLPFYLSGSMIELPVLGTIQPILVKAAIVFLSIFWNLTLMSPVINVWYSRMRYGIGNNPLPEPREPYSFVVILPVYNETFELLTEGIQSILDSNFPSDRIVIHVAFDNEEVSDLYLRLLEHFGVVNSDCSTSISVNINKTILWIHRWRHAGKRLCQAATWDFVKKSVAKDFGVSEINKNTTILFLTDSDNYTFTNTLRNFASNFDHNEDKLAFAGYMTTMSGGWRSAWNPIRWLQDTEYVSCETNRAFEILMGTTNCLPGGCTSVRYGAFESVADRYFTDLADTSSTDFQRNYLGEDRYLTHIMHQEFPKYSMGFCPSARSKTDPPQSLFALVKQRRRWACGAISNEAYMLTDSVIGKKYPFLILYKFIIMSVWRSLSFTQMTLTVMILRGLELKWDSISTYIFSMGIPLLISWAVVVSTSIAIGHYKVIFIYPFSHIPQSIIAFLVDWNVVFTFNQRSWGSRVRRGEHNV